MDSCLSFSNLTSRKEAVTTKEHRDLTVAIQKQSRLSRAAHTQLAA